MKIENRLYEAKDLKRILGLTPETIYLWLRTYHIFEPAERARGVRGKNKYSLLDLVKLALIANLQSFGMHLTAVREIFLQLDKASNGESLWNRIVNERDRFDHHGTVLIIARLRLVEFSPMGRIITHEPQFLVSLLSYDEAAKQLKMNVKAPCPRLIVNVNMIVKFVEMHAHEKLGQRNRKKMTG